MPRLEIYPSNKAICINILIALSAGMRTNVTMGYEFSYDEFVRKEFTQVNMLKPSRVVLGFRFRMNHVH